MQDEGFVASCKPRLLSLTQIALVLATSSHRTFHDFRQGQLGCLAGAFGFEPKRTVLETVMLTVDIMLLEWLAAGVLPAPPALPSKMSFKPTGLSPGNTH